MTNKDPSELSVEYSFKAGHVSRSNSSLTKNTSAESPSTRWWESYAVRYFIGFVIGSICIATLVIDLDLLNQGKDLVIQIIGPNPSAAPAFKPDWTSALFILCLLGFCYCYIASTPITVLHFGRYGHGRVDAHARHFWFGWALAITLRLIIGFQSEKTYLFFNGLIPLIWGIYSSCHHIISPQYEIEKSKSDAEKQKKALELLPKTLSILRIQSFSWFLIVWGTHSITMWGLSIYCAHPLDQNIQALWLFSAPVFWIGISQYFVLGRLFTEQEEIYKFYAKLFDARRQENAKDVRDSYSHLREHSNAVFIVVVELSILALLLALHRTLEGANTLPTPTSKEYLKFVFGGLAIWILPTVFLWGRANAFEKEFSRNPKRFLNNKEGEAINQ